METVTQLLVVLVVYGFIAGKSASGRCSLLATRHLFSFDVTFYVVHMFTYSYVHSFKL